jgi:site-specific recombinase XerD
MKTLDGIRSYLRRKRSIGVAYETAEFALSGFCRFNGDVPLEEVTTRQVLDFLNSRNSSTATRRAKYRMLRQFFEFWADRGVMPALLMPQLRLPSHVASLSFIYTQSEVRALILGTGGNQRNRLCVVSEQTLRTVLLALYGTGATTREIFKLKVEEVDLKHRIISMCGDRIVQSRRIPISHDVRDLLQNYLKSKDRKAVASEYVFVSTSGNPLKAHWMERSFVRLRARSGIIRRDMRYREPQMRDLRSTFAVHRIAAWIKEGADLNRMLPALSAYMGLSGVTAIERYLSLTPERFKKELNKLSPQRGRKRWRDDLALMKFLADL